VSFEPWLASAPVAPPEPALDVSVAVADGAPVAVPVVPPDGEALPQGTPESALVAAEAGRDRTVP
jgi:hypothetical protein